MLWNLATTLVRRFRPAAWLVSLGLHLLAGIVAARWLLPAPALPPELRLNTRWAAEAEKQAAPVEWTPFEPPPLASDAGGPAAAHPWQVVETLWPAEDEAVADVADASEWLSRSNFSSRRPEPPDQAQPTATVTAMKAGTGEGPGDQPGFFGMQPPTGQRVVFVVDNSRSMNHPHESPAKTRLRRLKIELINCILEMQPEQQFYVIFFSNETTPMPGSGLLLAQPGVRDPYLRWIAQLPSSGGPTNPLPALDLALRMQPDTICFLTDGDFDKRVKRILMSVQQQRTSIHTFAFGEVTAEETLKTLAEKNQGEYRFVP